MKKFDYERYIENYPEPNLVWLKTSKKIRFYKDARIFLLGTKEKITKAAKINIK